MGPGGGGGGEAPTQCSKKGGLTGPQFLERVTGKEWITFFKGGCNFYMKENLKSDIFNDKKVCK